MPQRIRQSRAFAFLHRNARWIGPVLYFCALGGYIYLLGLPRARDRVLFWILLGLLVFSLTDLRRLGRGIVFDWLPFVAILFVYDVLRGGADGMLFSAYTWPQLHADQWLGAGQVPTIWLQRHLWHGAAQISWYDYALWFVYLTHFFATLLVAGFLWALRPSRFRRYTASVITLAVLGLTTYALFPAVPPWMASEQGDLPPMDRIVGIVSPLVERGSHYANAVAAMPSLHAAYAMLIAIFFWKTARWYWRIPLALYPLAMGFSLVYTGEHYAVDIFAGWIYAAVAYLIVTLAANRLAQRSEHRRLLASVREPLPNPLEEPLPDKPYAADKLETDLIG